MNAPPSRYAIPSAYDDDFGEPAVDVRKTLLADVFTRKKKAIAYEYDFGDSWIHIIEFEGMVDFHGAASVIEGRGGSPPGKPRAVVCIDGARSGAAGRLRRRRGLRTPARTQGSPA